MRFLLRAGLAVVDVLVETIQWLSSNKPLFAGIIVLTAWWMLYNRFSAHPFDDWKNGLPKLVFWYTIVFGLWEGAQKIATAIQSRRDRAHQERVLSATEETLEIVRRLERKLL